MNAKKFVAVLLSVVMALSLCMTASASEIDPISLGENAILIPVEDYISTTFTPEVSGYYAFCVDNEELAMCWVDGESIFDGENFFYVMEAGETYVVEVYSLSEEEVNCVLTVEYFEEVDIDTPVALEITKLPNNTTFLSYYVENLWADNLFAGMEMKVTWDDGSVTKWAYDEESVMLGIYYLEWMIDPAGEVVITVPGVDGLSVSYKVNLLDIYPEDIIVNDDSALEIVEKSCGIDYSNLGLGDVWYYMPLSAYDRELTILFDDGSTVSAYVGDIVYGIEVSVMDNQGEVWWTKDAECLVTYTYDELMVDLEVEIVDSPVESIEILKAPTNNKLMLDEEFNMINAKGDYITTVKQFFGGMTLKVNYKDGTSKTFKDKDMKWVSYNGEDYPILDGYPLGLANGLLSLMYEQIEVPGQLEMFVEYMGAEDSYTLHFVEEFDEDDYQEEIPETGDQTSVIFVAVVAMMSVTALVVAKKKYF